MVHLERPREPEPLDFKALRNEQVMLCESVITHPETVDEILHNLLLELMDLEPTFYELTSERLDGLLSYTEQVIIDARKCRTPELAIRWTYVELRKMRRALFSHPRNDALPVFGKAICGLETLFEEWSRQQAVRVSTGSLLERGAQ